MSKRSKKNRAGIGIATQAPAAQPRREIVFLLDRSSSMQSMQSAAIQGFNSFLESQKQAFGDVRFTLTLFDRNPIKLYDRVPICEVPALTPRSYLLGYGTALFDTLGLTLAEVSKRHSAANQGVAANQLVLAVLTDGYDSVSRIYTHKHISDYLELMKGVPSVEMVFLAAGPDALHQYQLLNLPRRNTMVFDHSPQGFHEGFKHLKDVTAICFVIKPDGKD